ncbi:MAG TPA: glycosyltransferase family 2 protein [Candidatus Bathyarchaeia archaeon]|nr:glycosyltransferase family 2 protein [Candidatus Bathyarchaeia archaeon]
MFLVGLVAAFSFLALIFWAAGTTVVSLATGHSITDSLRLTVPQPLLWLGIGLPIIVLLEIAGAILLSRKRWRNKPHTVRWDVIPNHNIVVAMTAYNDEASIYDAVQEFKAQPDVKQVIVVDNNSTDRTQELALNAGAQVVREEKQGYGYACTRGLKEALEFPKVNVVVLVEGDMTFAGKDIAKMVPYLDNVDMVVGTRTTQELTTEDSQLNWFYVWGNMFLAKMTQAKFWDIKHWGRVRLTDVGCTMRAIRAEPLEQIVEKLQIGGQHFSPHMLMVAISNGLKVVEVPVTFRKRWGVSKGAGANTRKGFGIGLRMMWHILTF